jgi:hypothetical protein
MDKEITICLQSWDRLEPYLPDGVCERLTEDCGALPMLDCRMVPDEATYQKVLGIARLHCPELVLEIERHRRISASRADRDC